MSRNLLLALILFIFVFSLVSSSIGLAMKIGNESLTERETIPTLPPIIVSTY